MFIGRERELSSLEKLYRSDKFEFAVVYGRRRVGKTALLSHFIKDKNSIYFMGIESNGTFLGITMFSWNVFLPLVLSVLFYVLLTLGDANHFSKKERK